MSLDGGCSCLCRKGLNVQSHPDLTLSELEENLTVPTLKSLWYALWADTSLKHAQMKSDLKN
jgi:hypothetical protein